MICGGDERYLVIFKYVKVLCNCGYHLRTILFFFCGQSFSIQTCSCKQIKHDNISGTNIIRRDGRVVQLGEANGQVCGVRSHQAAHQRGDQGRGEGGTLPRPGQ